MKRESQEQSIGDSLSLYQSFCWIESYDKTWKRDGFVQFHFEEILIGAVSFFCTYLACIPYYRLDRLAVFGIGAIPSRKRIHHLGNCWLYLSLEYQRAKRTEKTCQERLVSSKSKKIPNDGVLWSFCIYLMKAGRRSFFGCLLLRQWKTSLAARVLRGLPQWRWVMGTILSKLGTRPKDEFGPEDAPICRGRKGSAILLIYMRNRYKKRSR